MGNYIGIVGIAVLLGIAFAFSSNRKAINLRIVSAAFLLQAAIAGFVMYFDAGRAFIRGLESWFVDRSHGLASLGQVNQQSWNGSAHRRPASSASNRFASVFACPSNALFPSKERSFAPRTCHRQSSPPDPAAAT